MSNLLIIDGNAIAHAAHAGRPLSVGGQNVQAVFGTIKTVRMLKLAYSAFRPIVLWDGRPNFRYELYPEYKANRKTEDPKVQAEKDDYKSQMPILQAGLFALGVDQIFPKDHEADDLAGIFVRNKKPNQKIVVVTGDQDWLQFIDKDVTWYDPIRERFVQTDNFQEFTGYETAESFLHGKALRGDTSDNIKGVGGIGEVGAKALLNEHGSVVNFMKKCKEGYVPKGKALQRLATKEGFEIFVRNMKIMDLKRAPDPEKDRVEIKRSQFDSESFQSFCEEWSFQSILRDFENFTLPFKGEK